MRSASQPVSVLDSGVSVSVCAPPDMVAQAGRRLGLAAPRWIQHRVSFAQANAACFAFNEMFPEFDDVRNRQPLADQKERQLIVGNVNAGRGLSLEDVLNQNTGVIDNAGSSAVADLSNDNHLPWQGDL